MGRFVALAVFLLGVLDSALGVNIQVSPNTVVVGVTRFLDVKCATTRGEDSGLESLISLILLRSTNPQDKNFKELASLTMFTPAVQTEDVSESNLTASGKIDNNGESYMRLVWEFPSADTAGFYKCEAHGVDHRGHPIDFNSTLMLTFVHPDVETVAREIKNLTLLVEKVNDYIELFKNGDFHLFVTKWEDRIEQSKKSLFIISEIFDGRRYYLSRQENSRVSENSEAMCKLFGGYLVEIDSQIEFEFITGFLSTKSTGYNTILTGATDTAHENVWINRHSNTTVSYVKWASQKPSGGTAQNCLVLLAPTWNMSDYFCSFTIYTFSLGYLCEIPEV